MPTINELRDERNWRYQDLAMRADLTITTVYKAARLGKCSKASLEKIARAFNVPIETIQGVDTSGPMRAARAKRKNMAE